jgi:hypothetical protein
MESIPEYKLEVSLAKILPILRSLNVQDEKERLILIEGINGTLAKTGILILPFLRDIFSLLEPLLLNFTTEGTNVISLR